MKIKFYSFYEFEHQSITNANTQKYDLEFFKLQLNERTAKLAEGAEVVSIFVNDKADEKVLKILHQLGVKMLLLRSAGYNNVDIEVAKKLNIAVACVPEYSPYAVAEHALALMMTLNRKIIKAHNRVRDLNFSLNGLTGFDFNGKTVGIAGFGKIGQKLANIMMAMGCKVLAFDIHKNEPYEQLGVEFVSFEELCKRSHIISLHLPLNSDTRYIVNKESIKWMLDKVMLINTGRGGLVDTKAVIKALKKGEIGYLGLDVYEEESKLFFEDHSDDILLDDDIARLLTFSNVLITSHQAFLTETALKNIADTVFFNLECYIKKEACGNFIV